MCQYYIYKFNFQVSVDLFNNLFRDAPRSANCLWVFWNDLIKKNLHHRGSCGNLILLVFELVYACLPLPFKQSFNMDKFVRKKFEFLSQ